MAATPIVGSATTRTMILTLNTGRVLDPIEVYRLGSLHLGRGPAMLHHLDLHDHQHVVLVMRTTTVIHNGLDAWRPVGNGLAVRGSREALLNEDLVGFPPEESARVGLNLVMVHGLKDVVERANMDV